MRVRVSSRFKFPPQLGVYEGKTNPMNHLDSYKNLVMLQGASNEVMCRAFSATLRGLEISWLRKLLEISWLRKLSPRTIDSFGDLNKFLSIIS